MRYAKTFLRQKGSASSDPLLGSDVAPTADPEVGALPTNMINVPAMTRDGLQTVNLCVALKCSGVTTSISAAVYVWEELSENWYLLGTVVLADDTISTIRLASQVPSADSPRSDGIVVAVVPADPGGGASNSVYTFALGYDSIPLEEVAGGTSPFPAAAPLSDTTANPTTTSIGAMGMVWDVVGAVWRRMAAYNVASDALTDPAAAVPIVGSFMVAWDNAAAKWRRILVDTNGSLKARLLDGAGSATLPNVSTPADATAYGSLTKLVSKLVASNGTTDDMLRAGLTAVQTAFTGMLNTLPFGKFNLTRPVLADTNGVALQIDQYGNLKIVEQAVPDYEDGANDVAWTQHRAVSDSLGAWSKYASGTTKVGTAGLAVSTTAGRLRRAHATNTHATNVYWLVLVDKASAAVNNDAVVAKMKLIPNGATPTPDCEPIDVLEGIYCTLGISLAISTTPEKVTLPGTSDCTVDALYS